MRCCMLELPLPATIVSTKQFERQAFAFLFPNRKRVSAGWCSGRNGGRNDCHTTPHHDGAGRPEARVGVDAPVRGRFQNFRGCLFVSRRRSASGGRSLLDSNVWVPGEAGMETRRISRPGIHCRSFSSSVEQQKLSDVPNALCVNNNIDAYGCQFSPK
ncbi:hypothetical protein PVAP13_9KG562700 [Panicum virgatum]|nr:hypothetical protein PVAP13_9KG562700 [Panicum virgatum]